MRKFIHVLILLTAITWSQRAQAYNGVWEQFGGSVVPARGIQKIKPEKASVFMLNEGYLRAQLVVLGTEPEHGLIIELPVPDGSYRSFRVWQTPMMEQPLAERYPGIKTFTAVAVDDPKAIAKIDFTLQGFHAMVFDGRNTYFIDPYSNVDDGFYNCYYRRDYRRPVNSFMTCTTPDEDIRAGRTTLTETGLPSMQFKMNGTSKRTYRLALACTMEYSQAVAGISATKPAVLSAMVTTMNRVNGVYEKEAALTMVLIANEDSLIYLPGGTDPYQNGNGQTMLGQNQTNVNSKIGAANYDIGHVFSTGGGGVASQGCVCSNGVKARGVTGSANPVGDAFDIDYVAHEMGHQFGCSHTFNANASACGNNGVQAFAYEPGSGSTIMAYAGICGSNNDLQQHSDDYFHAISLSEMSDFISSSADGGSCPVTTATGNTPPSLPSFSQVFTIPQGTPFELTAPEAIDADHDMLTYCWEQWNLGDFHADWNQTFLKGPIYRSYTPDTSRTRTFVKLDSLLKNVTSYVGEKLPDTPRYLTFKLTVRDVFNGLGSFNFPDDTIHVIVTNTGAPFRVVTPNTPLTWAGASWQTVEWNVAATDIAPVSCANVDIFLSVDGGHTYPYTLKTNTPNDGSELVNVPNIQATGSARIKVKASDNIFMDISNTNFTIDFNPNGIAEVSWANSVQVYPVPSHDFINIRNDHGKALTLSMFNAMGQKVWAGEVKQQLSIPVNGLAKGMYYLQMKDKSAGERIVKPVLVQ